MKKKKLYLHVGLPKCGSTTIQHFLFFNQDKWAEEGVGIYNPYKLSKDTLLKLWYMDPRWINFRSRNVTDFMQYTRNTRKFHSYILSDEMIYGEYKILFSTHSDFYKLFDKFNVVIIIYVRRFDDAALSSWKWHTEFLFTNGAPNFFDNRIKNFWDVKPFIKFLLSVKPTPQIKIRSYSYPVNNSIISDFINACESDRWDWDYTNLKSNKSISLDTCFALLHLKKVYGLTRLDPGIRNGLSEAIREYTDLNPSINQHLLSYKDRYKLCRSIDETTKWLEDNFSNGEPLYEPIIDTPVWQENVHKTYELANLIKKNAEEKGFVFSNDSIMKF